MKNHHSYPTRLKPFPEENANASFPEANTSNHGRGRGRGWGRGHDRARGHGCGRGRGRGRGCSHACNHARGCGRAIFSTLIRSSSSDGVEISVLVNLLCVKITTIIIKVTICALILQRNGSPILFYFCSPSLGNSEFLYFLGLL
ncbi:unnamed protein product [Prunus armeniaca]|uniref:Uncharacterized protein n=1 Tax=Prunus armeniaca TaxID=36596 RepID=A0A6J5VP48_PRUAR|nr:unnamed protein product [Prunus armeniaca]CAB4319459.1 unnamed protein product [Prunus armeniaca]